MSKTLRFVGDIHGFYGKYLELIKDVDYSLQVGDLGMNYNQLKNVDTSKHRAIGGNHDCYQKDDSNYFYKQDIFLGSYGIYNVEDLEIFYMRGAWSIDKQLRLDYMAEGCPPCWWSEEELNQEELDQAFEFYKKNKPKIVVTHECPESIVQYVTNPLFCLNFGFPAGTIETRTSLTLQKMFEYHQPNLWVFGHYHKRWSDTVNGTKFICLDMARQKFQNESDYYDMEIPNV